MQRLEVSCAVRRIYTSLGAKGLTKLRARPSDLNPKAEIEFSIPHSTYVGSGDVTAFYTIDTNEAFSPKIKYPRCEAENHLHLVPTLRICGVPLHSAICCRDVAVH